MQIHLKSALIRLLARVQRGAEPYYGLCNEIGYHGGNALPNVGGTYHFSMTRQCEIREAFNILQGDMFRSWEFSTGNTNYPISAPSDVREIFDTLSIVQTRGVDDVNKWYYQNSDRWSGHGKALRASLLRHCIAYIDDMTRVEYEARYGLMIQWS